MRNERTKHTIAFEIEPEYLTGFLVGKGVCPGDLVRGAPNANECEYEDECRSCIEKFLKEYTSSLTIGSSYPWK